MQAHVFIVNRDTFPQHLRFLFAGTGTSYGKRKKSLADWHSGLLSDIKRIRKDDLVIFYI